MKSPRPRSLTPIVLMMLLVGCGSFSDIQDGAPTRRINANRISNAVPKVLPRSKFGNPASYVVYGKRYYVKNSSKGFDERGVASWYGTKFHGRRTSSGERYNLYGMTAAMRTLPLPTFVEVTNLRNHKKIIVKVNDRGPFNPHRIIDLSYAAATKLDMLKKGTAFVEVRAIDPAIRYSQHTQYTQHHHTREDTPKTHNTSLYNAPVYSAAAPSISNTKPQTQFKSKLQPITQIQFKSKLQPITQNQFQIHSRPTPQPQPQTQAHSQHKTQHQHQPHLYLQVGAYSDRASATKLLHRLHSRIKQPSRINETSNHGIRIYRVQVGPITSVDTTDMVITQLENAGFNEPMTLIE